MHRFIFFFLSLLLITCSPKKTESSEQVADSLAATAAVDSHTESDVKPEEIDYADIKPTHVYFLGFSPDSKYVAFDVIEESFLDVTGARCIINVDKNDFATKSTKIDGGQEAGQEEVKDLLNEAGMPSLQKFDINGTNLGIPIDLDSANNDNEFLVGNKSYSLRLIVTDAPNGNKMFELDFLNGANIQVLQKDKKRPESRGPADSYYMKQAWYSGSKIAILIYYDSEPYVAEAATFKYRRALLVTGNMKL